MRKIARVLVLLIAVVPLLLAATDIDAAHQISPEALAKAVQSAKPPLVLNVGPQLLYEQAHVKGAEYIGAASSPEGLAKLRERVKALPKNTAIVLYCGCCPWDHCPNVRPAFGELQQMGFTHVKVMYIAHNIGSDWVDKGYPTDKGK